jgi:regulator of protease activity HflC (stomatin/prohibitin superfamily)
VQQVALTSLRHVIGQHDLDEVFKERDKINALLKKNVLENTAAWGVTVELLEMKPLSRRTRWRVVLAGTAEV